MRSHCSSPAKRYRHSRQDMPLYSNSASFHETMIPSLTRVRVRVSTLRVHRGFRAELRAERVRTQATQYRHTPLSQYPPPPPAIAGCMHAADSAGGHPTIHSVILGGDALALEVRAYSLFLSLSRCALSLRLCTLSPCIPCAPSLTVPACHGLAHGCDQAVTSLGRGRLTEDAGLRSKD